MKMRWIFFLIVFSLCIMMSNLFSKVVMAEQEDTDNMCKNTTSDQYLETFLDAIKNRDEVSAGELWPSHMVDSKKDVFSTLFDFWDGREISSYKKLDETERPRSEEYPKGKTYLYQIESGTEIFQAEFSIADNYEGKPRIDSFHFLFNPEVTGTLSTWKQFNMAQWLITFLAIGEIIVSFYIVINCLKKKPKLWGIWILFILLAYGGIAFDTVGGFKLTFYVYVLTLPKILNYQNLGIQIYFSLPIGAVIYWMKYGKK